MCVKYNNGVLCLVHKQQMSKSDVILMQVLHIHVYGVNSVLILLSQFV